MRDPLPAERVTGRRAALTIAMVVAAVAALALARPRLAGTIGVLVAIIAMIMLHELGHFVMAKRAGMKVTEFFLGFGPRLWSFRRGETEYGVKAIPAGGYVRIIGMSNVEDIDPADEERTYRAKPYRHRLGVAVAGSAMHFIIASVLLFLVYAAAGLPSAKPVVDHIEPGFPAASSDFRLGDRIVAINGQKVDEWEDVPTYVQSHGEDQLVFTVEREGAGTLDIALTPRMESVGKKQVPKVGIGPQVFLERESPPVAIGRTIGDMPRFTWATIKALGGIFSPSGVENYTDLLTGKGGDNSGRLLSPYGAARVASQAVESGWAAVLMFLFAINVFVGVFNMVPLLPLDGGHVAIATYEKIASMVTKRKVQVDVARLMPITAAVLLVLVVMGISALYLDIVNPVEGP